MDKIAVGVFTRRKKSLEAPNMHFWVFISLALFIIFCGLYSIRPNADDYSSLGRAFVSCDTLSEFSVAHMENSLGFQFLSKVLFCGLAPFGFLGFQILVSLIASFSIWVLFLAWVALFRSKRAEALTFALLSYSSTAWMISNGETPIRQYTGPLWSMQWIQHSGAFILLILCLCLYASNWWRSGTVNLTVTNCVFMLSATYSVLNLLFTLPALLIFWRDALTSFSRNKKNQVLVMAFMFATITITSMNIFGSSRGQRALLSQGPESSFERFAGLMILSIRENLVAHFWVAALGFLVGGFVFRDKDKVDLKKPIMFLFLNLFWIFVSLFFVEFFTYFATWHHRHFGFLIFLLSSLIGVHKLSGARVSNVIHLACNCLIFFLLCSTVASVSQSTRYAIHWDSVYRETRSISSQTDLSLPLGLGDRSNDPYWKYFQSSFGKVTQESKRFPALEIDNWRVFKVLKAPLAAYDYAILQSIPARPQRDRLFRWFV